MNFNMQQAMKQVQKMQAEMARVQQELEEKTVEVSVGGGAVALAISGQLEVKSVRIAPEAAEDPEMLQDLVLAAVNEGIKRAKEMAAQEMEKVTGKMKIPGMPGLF
ncbi:MAG TPA: YbaB/EbfC family nucleoid-associated protein [Firmicutes bacterium]|jgi:DNA-binding YbaB/EbfC family protein|nr:YbaB/EbfC family nucleoid-associated protein [Bacillota bacterium]HOQ24777.1 YbaB/EbfC family nucleoid-associated protein [Bacillota bacterium]HPT68010.1 YbaB/EbfC family nucleoid-associated protein [Bacillota bacterium]